MADASLGVRILDDLVVEVSGDDARSWLQGQVTCDLTAGERPAATYGLVLGAKGRIVSDVWVYDEGDPDRIWMALPRGSEPATPERTLERLERYLVMEDVELEPTPLRVLSRQHTAPDQEPLVAMKGSYRTDRLAGGLDQLLSVSDAEAERAKAVAAGARPLEARGWAAARVRLRKPAFPEDSADALPQEAGLKHAVSFNKGCYFGQEAVVMLEHRGKPPRRTVALALPALPTELPAPVEAAGREIGMVTSAADAPGGEVVALARLKRKALETEAPLEVAGTRVRVLAVLE